MENLTINGQEYEVKELIPRTDGTAYLNLKPVPRWAWIVRLDTGFSAQCPAYWGDTVRLGAGLVEILLGNQLRQYTNNSERIIKEYREVPCSWPHN